MILLYLRRESSSLYLLSLRWPLRIRGYFLNEQGEEKKKSKQIMNPNKKRTKKTWFQVLLRFLLAPSLGQVTLVSLGLDFFINKTCGAEGVVVVN